jgi:hypothetical protein
MGHGVNVLVAGDRGPSGAMVAMMIAMARSMITARSNLFIDLL